MTKIELRPYQDDLIDRTIRELQEGKRRILVVSPTGSGKSVTLAALILLMVSAGKRVLVVAHLEQLIVQLGEHLERWLDPELVGFIAGGRPKQYERPCQIASVQTLARRQSVLEEWEFNAVFVDEAHVGSFARSMEPIFAPAFKGAVLGWTASPYRTRSKFEAMADKYEVLVPGPTPAELTEMGFLCPMRYWSLPGGIDITGIHVVAGELKASELETVANTEAMRQHALNEWQRLATDEKHGAKAGRITLCFCSTKRHAADMAADFCERFGEGTAAAVDADTPLSERQELYRRHVDPADPLTCLTSISVISIGYDSPQVSAILALAATLSEARWIQAIGRGSRVHPGKGECRVIDCCGNTLRHGVLTDQGDGWVLRPPEGGEPGEAPHKFCENCGALNHASVPRCSACDTEFPKKPKPEKAAQKLQEVKAASKEDRRKAQFQRFCKQAYKSQFRPKWAEMKFKDTAGQHPPANWRLGAIFGPEPSQKNLGEYALQLGMLSAKHGQGLSWALGPLADEFGDELLTDHMALATTWWTRGVNAVTAQKAS